MKSGQKQLIPSMCSDHPSQHCSVPVTLSELVSLNINIKTNISVSVTYENVNSLIMSSFLHWSMLCRQSQTLCCQHYGNGLVKVTLTARWISLLNLILCVYRPHHHGGALEGVAPGPGQRGGYCGATLPGRWQPPIALHFQQSTSKNGWPFSRPTSPRDRMADTQETCRECFWYAELAGTHVGTSVHGLWRPCQLWPRRSRLGSETGGHNDRAHGQDSFPCQTRTHCMQRQCKNSAKLFLTWLSELLVPVDLDRGFEEVSLCFWKKLSCDQSCTTAMLRHSNDLNSDDSKQNCWMDEKSAPFSTDFHFVQKCGSKQHIDATCCLLRQRWTLTWKYLLQEPDVDFEVSGDVLVLPAVLRKDSGIYQCRPLDVDVGAEVKGEVLLTVHCK